jgi:hypothetical protein
MRIHVYYRHYNVSGREPYRPEWFSYEKSTINFIMSAGCGSRKDIITTNLVMDGNINPDKDFILWNYVHSIKAGSDWESFRQTVEIIKNNNHIDKNDLIYFLENDYMHVENWIDKVIELYSTYKVGYVSLYDHNDKYFLPQYSDLASSIIVTKTHHWRTTPSTCGSFILPKWLFDEDYDILSTMVGDHNKFLYLAETRGRFVLTPIPGLSTHCMQGLESPTIKWNEL